MFEYNIRYHATNCLYRISHNASKRFVAFFMTIMSAIVPCIAQIDAEMVTYMGRNALSVDDYLTAIHYFNQAIESKPFLAAPYYYRAYAKFTLEDYRGAETDCDKSINLNPFQRLYWCRGRLYTRTEKQAQGSKFALQPVSLLPTTEGL